MSEVFPHGALEQSEAQACSSLFNLGAELFGTQHFRVAAVGDGAALICPRWPGIAMFNRVIGLGSRQRIDGSTLDALIDLYDGNHVPLAIELPPDVLDDEIKHLLRERHVRSAARTAIVCARAPMACPVVSAWDARVADHAEHGTVGSICQSVFGMPEEARPLLAAVGTWPGWTQWIVHLDDQAAAAGPSFGSEYGCWFGWAATLPQFRGRGVKGALDRARVQGALSQGHTLLSSETAPDRPEEPSPSFRSWRRLGFDLAYVRHTLLQVPAH